MFLCFGKYVFQGGNHNPTHLSAKRARPGNSRISRGPRALGAEARGDSTKNRTPSEIEEVCGLGSVQGIVWLLPGAGGESLDRLPIGKGHVLGRERGCTLRLATSKLETEIYLRLLPRYSG